MCLQPLYHKQCEKYLKSKEIIGVFPANAVTCTKEETRCGTESVNTVSRNGGRLLKKSMRILCLVLAGVFVASLLITIVMSFTMI